MENWEKTSEKLTYNGWRKIITKQFKLPNGLQSDFDIVGNNAYVTIAAFTSQQKAILVKQFRPGPEIPLISFAEGYIDAEESPAIAAERELLEETGYKAGKIDFLKEKRSAYSTEYQFILLATDCKLISQQNLDDNEFIEVFTLDLPDFRKMLRNPELGNFTNIDAAYLALDHLNWL